MLKLLITGLFRATLGGPRPVASCLSHSPERPQSAQLPERPQVAIPCRFRLNPRPHSGLLTAVPDARIASTMRAATQARTAQAAASRTVAKVAVFLMALGLLCDVRAGHPKKMLHADETNDGRTVKIPSGDLLELTLAENPTTGFRWQFVEQGTPACALLEDAYDSKGTNVPGQGGVHRWKFRAAEPGVCKIELVYRRAWEQDVAPGRSFRLKVEVRKGSQGKVSAASAAPARPAE